MQPNSVKLGAVLLSVLCGCAGIRTHSGFDEFDNAKIDQMSGNVVSGRIFGATLVGLNARRETRRITVVTNQSVTWITNQLVSAVTNLIVTTITNSSSTVATNVEALPTIGITAASAAEQPASTDTNAPATLLAPAGGSTNQSIFTANNQAVSRAPNQMTATIQLSTALSTQTSTRTNNLTITTQNNQQITTETNRTVTTTTNQTITSMTNLLIVHTNLLVRDYFLYTELITPPDFVLSPNESLVLLIDGARNTFTQTNSTATFVGRKGFTYTFYRVPPEVLVAIANANEVKIRLRGVNTAIERAMPASSRRHFREFVAKYFVPESDSILPEAQVVNPTEPAMTRL